MQTIRIATQPFPQYTNGLSHDAALAMLRGIDALGAKLAFTPSIGPAMWNDGDSSAAVDLLIDFLAEPGRTNASLITAGEDGIHWNAIRQAARLIDAVSRRSLHGAGQPEFRRHRDAEAVRPVLSRRLPSGSAAGCSRWAWKEPGVVAEVFAQEHEPRAAEEETRGCLDRAACAVEKIAPRWPREAAGAMRASIQRLPRWARYRSAAPSNPLPARRSVRAAP